jgi:hypothetical protein
MVIKVVYSMNYVPGRRKEYLEWVKKSVPIFLAPEEVKKMSAYVNWTRCSPHRVVEFEFEDVAAMENWASREDIKKVSDEWIDLSTDQDATILELVYEKAK